MSDETWADGTPKTTLTYTITWWERTNGYLVLHQDEHPTVAEARRAYLAVPSEKEPGAFEDRWDPSTREWKRTDLVDQSTLPEQIRDARRVGIGMLRSVVAHKRGVDSRGATLTEAVGLGIENRQGGFNSRGHDHHKGAAACPVCSRAAIEDDPSECPVCDYLCEHGIEPHHPLAKPGGWF